MNVIDNNNMLSLIKCLRDIKKEKTMADIKIYYQQKKFKMQ